MEVVDELVGKVIRKIWMTPTNHVAPKGLSIKPIFEISRSGIFFSTNDKALF
jgi:hypothetical protein